MESKFFLSTNGQQVVQSDFNTIGDVAGLADDRIFAELFKMRPYDGTTTARGIIPSGQSPTGVYTNPLVASNGATGSVLVNPFRAFVGSRTLATTDGKANFRDIRSGLCVGATALTQQVSLSANASGNGRWDLVYATVAVDANSTGVTRKIKDPTTKVISSSSLVVTLQTTVALSVIQGTASATPTFPLAPSDAGSSYNIPIAYIWVPNGFTVSTVIPTSRILIVAPFMNLSSTTGAKNLSIATVNQFTNLDTTGQNTWNATNASTFLPPVTGGESLILLVDARTTGGKHPSGTVLDNSRDWRNRYWKFTISSFSSAADFASNFVTPGTAPISGASGPGGASTTQSNTTNSCVHGVGHSFDTTNPVLTCNGNSTSTGNVLASMPVAAVFSVKVDSAGRLVVNYSGAPNSLFFIWLESTPKMY